MIRVPEPDLRAFALRVLTAAGAGPADAATVADGLVWADLRGRFPQGVIRLAKLVAGMRSRRIVSPATMRWTPLGAALQRLDAGDAFGQVAGAAAMQRAVFLARREGIGAVVVRRSNHFGAAGWLCARAVEAGCLGLACTNAAPKVAPFGGTRPVLGTNPLAFGCPTRSGGPLLVDLSTSMMAGSNRREMEERGESLPSGVALDRDGRPTTDPAAVRDGCLLPAAGPKGFGLGLMVEILAGVLSGAAIGRDAGSIYEPSDHPANTGHFVLAVDVGHVMPRSDLLERVAALIDWVHDTPGADGGVRFPGEIRARLLEENRRGGIPLPPSTLEELTQLGHGFGVAPPWNDPPHPPQEARCLS